MGAQRREMRRARRVLQHIWNFNTLAVVLCSSHKPETNQVCVLNFTTFYTLGLGLEKLLLIYHTCEPPPIHMQMRCGCQNRHPADTQSVSQMENDHHTAQWGLQRFSKDL